MTDRERALLIRIEKMLREHGERLERIERDHGEKLDALSDQLQDVAYAVRELGGTVNDSPPNLQVHGK